MASIVEEKYRVIEKSIHIETPNRIVTYNSPVNFQESMQMLRHRWFPYKEGFSPTFVQNFLNKYSERENKNLLDPFSGVGTTLIAGAELGYNCFGFEVNPLAHFVASVKSLSFNSDEKQKLKCAIDDFKSSKIKLKHEPPANKTVVSYFEQEALDALLSMKYYYKTQLEGKTQQIFKLVFLRLIEQFSTHRKAGNGVKKRTRLLYDKTASICEQLKAFAILYLNEIYEDILAKFQGDRITIVPSSCLLEHQYPSTIFGSVLTSPPYANCFDYSKIYLCELWLGDFFTSKQDQVEFRKSSIRSHVHARWEDRHVGNGSSIIEEYIHPELSSKDLWSSQIPGMLKGYFEDIGYLLKMLHGRLEIGATVGFVVSNSVYGGIPIATDLIITELAEKHNYEPIRIEIYRHIVPSSQQYQTNANKKYFRESLVVLKRKG